MLPLTWTDPLKMLPLPRFPHLAHFVLRLPPFPLWPCAVSWQDDQLELVSLLPFCSRYHEQCLAHSEAH